MSRSQTQEINLKCPSLAELYPDVREDQDELFSFWVKASDGQNEYKVQLHLYNFNGWCGCQNYEFACWPKLTRGANPATELKCKHIRLVRDYYLDKILRDTQTQLQANYGSPLGNSISETGAQTGAAFNRVTQAPASDPGEEAAQAIESDF